MSAAEQLDPIGWHVLGMPSDALDHASRLDRLGLTAIELWGINADGRCECGNCEPDSRSRGKHPVKKRWQTGTSERSGMAHRNLGLRMGKQPNGMSLIAIDIDGPESRLVPLIERWGPLPETLTARAGGGGQHRVFRWPDGVKMPSNSAKKHAPDVDIRSDRGQIVVAPSRHFSGNRYEWTRAIEPVPLPDAWVEGLTAAPALPLATIAPAPTERRNAREARARAYIDTMPPAISGQGGHLATWKVARKLLKDFELDEATALRIMREVYNPRCRPPWSEKDLLHKVQDAGQAHTTNPVADRAFEPTEVITSAAPVNDGGPLQGLQHLSKVALLGRDKILGLAAEPIEYVWQDIAVAGTIILISGPPAEGKTTLLFLILAARLNYGEPVKMLGRELLPAPPGKYVVLIEGEHSEHSSSRKLVKSFEILGLDNAGLERVIIIARKSVMLGSPEWVDVVTLIQRGLVSDVAIDTVARVAPADANDEREQVSIFAQVAKAIEAAPEGDTQPLAWAVTHNRKNGGDDGLAAVSGSTQRTGQADTVLMVKGEKVGGQTVSSTVTFQKLREDPDEYPKPATFAVTKANDGSWCLKDEGKAADDRPLEVRIMELIADAPKTKTKLGSLLGRSNADVDEAISNLFNTHEITTTKVQVNGREYTAFTPRRSTGRAPDEHPDPDEHRTTTGLH